MKQGDEVIREMINTMHDVSDGEPILVKHMEGTADYQPNDGSATWKAFWERKLSQKFPSAKCVCDCCKETRMPEEFVGAHIVDVNNSNNMYIYPLCEICNDKYGKNKEPSPSFWVRKSLCADFSLSELKPLHPEESKKEHL